MKTIALLYFGIGLSMVLVKCIMFVHLMSACKMYLRNDGIYIALLTLVLDILAWPIDIVYMIKYKKDNEFKREIIYELQNDIAIEGLEDIDLIDIMFDEEES